MPVAGMGSPCPAAPWLVGALTPLPLLRTPTDPAAFPCPISPSATVPRHASALQQARLRRAAQPASLPVFSWSAEETVAGRPPHTRAKVAVAAQRPVRVDAGLGHLAQETGLLRAACAYLAAKEDVAGATPKNVPWAV